MHQQNFHSLIFSILQKQKQRMTDVPKITLKQYIVCNNYRKSLDLYNRSKQKKPRRKTYLQVGDGPRVKSEALIQKQVKQVNMFVRGLIKQDRSFSKFEQMMAQLLRIFVREISFLRSSNNAMNSMMKMSCARSQFASNILGLPEYVMNSRMQDSKYTKNNCNENQSPQQSILREQSNIFEINLKLVQEGKQNKRRNQLMQRSFLQIPNMNNAPMEIKKQSNSCLFSKEKHDANQNFNSSKQKRKSRQDFMMNLNQQTYSSQSITNQEYEKSQIERSNVQVFLNDVDTEQHMEQSQEFNFLDESLPQQSTMRSELRSEQKAQKRSSVYIAGKPFLTNSIRNSKLGIQEEIKGHQSSSIIKKASLYKDKYKKRQNEHKKSKQNFLMDFLPDSNSIKQNRNKVKFKRDRIDNNISYQLKSPPCLKVDIHCSKVDEQKTNDLNQSYITESTVRNKGSVSQIVHQRSKIVHPRLFQ